MSGLDVESLVKAASASTKNAINSRSQKLQTLQWKQEAYRSIITALSDFQSKYLDIASSSSIRANAVMKSNKAESSNDKLSVIATSTSTLGDYSITSVQKAQAATLTGTKASSGGVQLDFSAASQDSKEHKVTVTLDGTAREITFQSVEGDYDKTQENFLNALNDKFSGVSNAKFSFDENNGKLVINNAEGDKVSHIFTVGWSDSVGLKNDASNTISTSMTLGGLDFSQRLSSGPYEFSINGVDFKFDKDTTIKDMMNTINKSDAGVTMSFSSLTQSFTLETSQTGAGQELNIKQTSGNLINSLFNISSDVLNIAPTVASSLTDKTLDANGFGTNIDFIVDKDGLASGDSLTINGKELAVTGLTQVGATAKIEVNGKEITALVYEDQNAGKESVYRYTENGVTHYAKKNGDKYDDIMTVEDGEIVANGATVEGKTEKEWLEDNGIYKKYEDYSKADMEKAFNDAYKASFPDGKGKFTVHDSGDAYRITFETDEATSVSSKGMIDVMPTGMTDINGNVSNFTEVPYPLDKEIAGEITFVANGKDIVTVGKSGENGKTTIQDLVDTGYFEYDADKGVLSVTGKNILQVEPSTSLDDTMVIQDMFGTLDLVGTGYTNELNLRGSNAQMTINGVTLESGSNTFTVEGTSFNIEKMDDFTEEDIANGDAEEITVNVSKDNSKLKETILDFMDAYNQLLTTIHDALYTARPKKDNAFYDPLTEEQEEEMDQDEIDKWNEKAKEGLLFHDTTLTKVFTQLRTAINANVDGFTIQALGIDTEEYGADSYGRLRLMKDGDATLDSAIERYSDEIAAFFTDPEKGLGSILNNAVNAAIDKSISSSGGYPKGSLTSLAGIENTRSDKKNYLYSQIESMQKIIDNLKEKYESQQERLWKQYTALETYILQMNSQSSELFGTSASGQ